MKLNNLIKSAIVILTLSQVALADRGHDRGQPNPPRYPGDRPGYGHPDPVRPGPVRPSPRPDPVRPDPVRPNPRPEPVRPRPEPTPSRPDYAVVTAYSITRATGGQWARIEFPYMATLDNLQLYVSSAGLKIYDVIAYNEYGQRINIYSMSFTRTLRPGESVYSERLHSYGRIRSIDLRLESMGGYANATIRIESLDYLGNPYLVNY